MNSRPAVRLAAIRQEPLSVEEALAAVADPAAGAQCVFIGTVRDIDHQRAVAALAYSAHPTALADLERICAAVADRPDVIAVAATHRLGELKIGDVAVVVAVSSGHRSAAFAGARELIDTLKRGVPIWKRQDFCDGEREWVGLPCQD